MNFGLTARHLRQLKGITQRAAADLLEISDVHLCNLERGRATPSIELCRKYDEVFGHDLYVETYKVMKEFETPV